jgi:hypothetical protein
VGGGGTSGEDAGVSEQAVIRPAKMNSMQKISNFFIFHPSQVSF